MVRDDKDSLAECYLDFPLVIHSVLPCRSQEHPLGRSSFLFQMEAPLRLALDTPQSPVSQVLLCRTIIDHMNRELVISVAKHGNTLNCLAPRPDSKLQNTISR
jgi:hypothetical protein